jgi:hypothetical protein
MARKPADALTGELFSQIPTAVPAVPGAMDFRKPVAELVAGMLANAKRDRYDISARISRLCDHETSKALLDSYTAPSREECNLPLWKVPAIEIACNSRDVTEWLVGVHGGRVLWGEQVLQADLGQIESRIQHLMEQRRQVKEVLRRAK